MNPDEFPRVFCTVTVRTIEPEVKRGLPVHDSEIKGYALGRRDIIVTLNGTEKKFDIDTLRIEFYAGLIPAESPVLVTNNFNGEISYCGEGTVGDVIAAWESAPLESYDAEDAKRMTVEFDLPHYNIPTKAAYHDLRRLYKRCDAYYRHIASKNKEFKRFSKIEVKDFIFLLDNEHPDWDSADGTKRFEEELRRRHPELLRTEAEKREKKERDKINKIKREENRPLTQTRNFLTEFPHKKMVIEVKDQGIFEIRQIKPKLSEGSIIPETLVRFRPESDWMELLEFLVDWRQNKATERQISYLESLQRQHGIDAEIPLDSSRTEISKRIEALVPKNNNDSFY
jgi:hypothetical protein